MDYEALRQMSDTGAERALLSIALQHPDTLFEIFSEVSPSDFSNFGNQQIARILSDIVSGKYQSVGKVDFVLVSNIASQEGILKDIGGPEYIEKLAKLPADRSNLSHYITQVKWCSARRFAYEQAQIIQEQAINPPKEASDAVSFLTLQEQRFAEAVLSHGGVTNKIVPLGKQAREYIEHRIANPDEHKGIPTGFPLLDEQIGGLEPGRLYVVAARLKNGKSWTQINMSVNIARQGVPTLYVDTEMTRKEIINRVLSVLSGVPEYSIRTGRYIHDPDKLEAVMKALDEFEKLPLYYENIIGMGLHKVQSLIKLYKVMHNIGFVAYDYIKVPVGFSSANMTERQYLGQVATMLKDLAVTLEIPILAGAQLNRTASKATDFSDDMIAESDRIAWFADVIFFQRWKPKEEVEQNPSNGNLILSIGVSRVGGEYKGHFDVDDSMRMTELFNEMLPSRIVVGDDSDGAEANLAIEKQL